MGIACKGYPDRKFKSIMKKLDNQMKEEEITKKKSRKSDRKVQKDEYKEI